MRRPRAEMLDRYLGVRIPPSNLNPAFLEQAQAFANKLADGLAGTATETQGSGGA